MNRFRAGLLLALLAATVLALPAHADDQPDLPTRKRMWSIAERLDCPVCQGQSVRESNAQLAAQMREIILIKLQAGESETQIMDFFADRYGGGVLREPPREGLALGVWIGPVVILGLGILLLGWVFARGRQPPVAAVDGDLEAYERQVDDLRQARRDSPPPA
ncbi:MAG: cytochrome c-type biogenesis protein CcmH [Chloroflexota bacterium]|nr:cytochrome c-type biogenesis protein CcmH [Chloroflexota bacterium]